jgi:hypothetical protein
MQKLLNSYPDDEVDLREFFMALWAYKLFIASTCAIGIAFSAHYILNADKKYTSTAIFKLDDATSGGISLGGEYSVLAGLTGFSGASNTSSFPTDQANGRIFIEKLDATLNFQADSYFNTYNPKSVEPIWKTFIKRAIGWQKSSTDTQEIIWQGIISNYYKNVELLETIDGSSKVVVTHVNPKRAAEIANVLMDTIISTTKNRKDREQDQQLSYLSNTLAKALNDLEVSQSNLKEFALGNSMLPLENFAAGSLQLDSLREQLNKTSKLHDAVAALSLMLQNKTIEQKNYVELRQKFPIVDQVEFRRVLGQNEIISSWTWPDASSVGAVFDTLSERKIRLQSQINASQIDAERSGLALEAYGKLEREAKIAEATYTVLIEQVKAQSMAAGYRPDKTEVYEYASASINSSAPKRSQILALGAILGLFLGAAFSLILALRRGVYFSKNSLKAGAQARLTANFRTLLKLRNKSLSAINKLVVENHLPVLRDMAVEINKNTGAQVVVTSSQTILTGNDVARALGSYMQSETMKVAIIDFSSRSKKLDIDDERQSFGSFVFAERIGNVSVLCPDGDLGAMELLSQNDFLQNIQSLNSTFNLVFLCADNENAISLLNTLEGQRSFHITLARTKRTKSATLKKMHSLIPIKGLLHD